MNGCLDLRAGVRDGRTVLLECRAAYPLQVTRPQLSAGDGSLSLILLLLSGGVLDGDQLALDVTLEPGARLALRTQAATQIHTGRSSQSLRATVDEGAWLSYVPQALVPHAGAEFASAARVQLAPGARVLLAETLAPGRTRFGEAFSYRSVRLDVDVWSGQEVLARERALIEPDARLRAARFGPATHLTGVYMLGPGAEGPAEGDPGLGGQGPLVGGGQVTRAAGAGPGVRCGRSELALGGWLWRAAGQRAVDLDAWLAELHARWWSRG